MQRSQDLVAWRDKAGERGNAEGNGNAERRFGQLGLPEGGGCTDVPCQSQGQQALPRLVRAEHRAPPLPSLVNHR